MSGFRYLSRADVIAAGGADWEAAIRDVYEATALLDRGEAAMVAESVLPLGADPRDKAYGLPATLAGRFDAAGLKWTLHKAAASGSLPAIISRTLVHGNRNGQLRGIVESALLTRMRTAAVSALAIKHLLPQPPSVVAVLGAGEMAASHVDMLSAVFPDLETLDVWNRSSDRLETMLAQARGRSGLTVRHLATPEETDAEVVLCCTSSPQPIVGASMVRSGRLIAQIGYNEVSAEAINASDTVCVDLWGEFARTSAKSLFQAWRAGRFEETRVDADLPDLLVRGFRPTSGASVYFSSFGLNIFDLALAARIVQTAEERGIGQVLPLI